MNKNDVEEIGERVIAALYEENNGVKYKRQHIVEERALDAKFIAAVKVEPLCQFKNKYGWCKLPENHKGSHTVINLGWDDDEDE